METSLKMENDISVSILPLQFVTSLPLLSATAASDCGLALLSAPAVCHCGLLL